MIAEELAGKRIAVTGATGFLGTALVERLLRSVPACSLVLLVRPGRRLSAARRVQRDVFRNDAFGPVREQWGSDFDAMVERRVEVLSGDVSRDGLGLDPAGREAFASCDVVIHAAATVSFDSPLDLSVETNLLGPNRILGVLHEAGARPHFLAVSTCYVAGNRRGAAPEEFLSQSPFHVEVDWRAEVEAARRARPDLEARSRTPARLREFGRAARRELGPAGLPLLSAKTEQLRRSWVEEEMVEAGRSRAQSLGWPDVYTYSKALGERALVELRGEVPLTVVRPSIIESAWSDPQPGWIRGFRMAEPLIISYAKGELHQFPGYPEGIIDVIPVDMVAAALCAIAAAPAPVEPQVFHVASGSVNPLRYRLLTETTASWFRAHPVYDAAGHPISAPDWEYTGSTGLEERLGLAQRSVDRIQRLAGALPLRGARAGLVERLSERRELVDQMLEYVKLYGAYGRCEAVYGVERLLQLWSRLDAADRATFGFDPRVIDWPTYITEVHLPTVVVQARVKTSPERRTGPSRDERLRRAVLDPHRQFAAFDLENTLIASNVVESYSWLATRRLGPGDRLRFAARTLAQGPGLWRRDRIDRTDFLRFFYRRYEGAPVDELEQDSMELLSRLLLPKSFPAGLRRVREHRQAGHRTVLITGALDIVTRPLRPLFDDVIAATMTVRDGCWSGELVGVPPTGEVRAQVMLDWAAQHGFDPAQGVAYADAASDLPMLEAVGFPVAVNPEPRLITIARKRGWLQEDWTTAPGSPKPRLPVGPRILPAVPA